MHGTFLSALDDGLAGSHVGLISAKGQVRTVHIYYAFMLCLGFKLVWTAYGMPVGCSGAGAIHRLPAT